MEFKLDPIEIGKLLAQALVDKNRLKGAENIVMETHVLDGDLVRIDMRFDPMESV